MGAAGSCAGKSSKIDAEVGMMRDFRSGKSRASINNPSGINKRASLIVQHALKSNAEIFRRRCSHEDDLYHMSMSQDDEVWSEIKKGIEGMNEGKRMEYMQKIHTELRLFIKSMKVLTQLASETNIKSAILSMTRALKVILNCEAVTLFILNHEKQELRTYSGSAFKLKVPFGHGIAGKVAATGKSMLIEDAYSHPLFSNNFDLETGFKTKTILCVALEDEHKKRMAVLEAVNCRDGPFREMHEVNMNLIGVHLCNAIKKCQLNYRARQQEKGSKALLELFKILYADIPLDKLIEACVDTVSELISAERSALFLYDEARDILWSKSAQGVGDSLVITLSANEGLAGKAFSEDRIIRADTLVSGSGEWESKFDNATGYKTRNLLTVPLKDSSGRKVGVIQALNKKVGDFDFLNDSSFTSFDEELLGNFTEELGRAVGQRILEASFQFKIEAQWDAGTDNQDSEMLRDQLMEYMPQRSDTQGTALRHQASSVSEQTLSKGSSASTSRAKRNSCFSKEEIEVWHLDVSEMSKPELCKLVKDIFTHVGIHTLFDVSDDHLINFIQDVSDGYNDVPYHNFNHAVSVLHGVFGFLLMGGLLHQLEDVEILALAVSALCHDIGHDGYTNGYHVATGSELASTYNDIHIQENYHASLCNRLVTKQDNRFVTLSPEDNRKFRKLIIQLILSTDMAEHMELTTQFSNSEPDYVTDHGRLLVMKAVLHAVDVSTPTKPHKQALVQATKLSEEFQRQVESELDLGLKPSRFMAPKDRAAKVQLELNFIDYVVYPIWQKVVEAFPSAKPYLKNLDFNRDYYHTALKDEKAKVAQAKAQ